MANGASAIFGRALREAREERGLSQGRLAARVRLSRATIGKIEAGQLRVSLDDALELCNALGVRLVDLLGEDVQVGDQTLSAVEVRLTLGSNDPFATMPVSAALLDAARTEATERTLVNAAAIWQQAPSKLRDLFAEINAELSE